ncbi:MAG: YbaY family lipoprotein [Betaproteobacteria bacterium]
MNLIPIRWFAAALAALAAVALAACNSVEPAPAAAATTPSPRAEAPRNALQGSVIYRERVALPAQAQVKVQLVDTVSDPRLAVVVAETTFASAGRQVPIPFTLPLDVAKFEPGRAYVLRAYILIDGAIQYVTSTRVNVDPRAPPASVSLLVTPGTQEPEIADSPAPPGAVQNAGPGRAPRASQQQRQQQLQKQQQQRQQQQQQKQPQVGQ